MTPQEWTGLEWTEDVRAGDWLRERIDDPWRGTMHDVVPRGFAAYARVFHPTTRSKPVDRPWPPQPQDRHRREWEAFTRAQPEITTLDARWRDAAAAFGTSMHPLAQWGALVRARGDEWNPNDWQRSVAPDGWEFDAPEEGRLDPEALAIVAGHLLAAGPTTGYAAVWAGWGGLLGHLGVGPSRVALTFTDEALGRSAASGGDAADEVHQRMLAASTSDPFNRPFGRESWQPGILSDEISRGPQLELPGRDHVLFRGSLGIFANARWPELVPWAETPIEGNAWPANSPSILWPDDRGWVLVTEVDWDSTIVAGDAALVDALCRDERIEALRLPADASLGWDADAVND